MRNLFVCCDGTWNMPTDMQDGVPVPTNVYKFHVALADMAAGGTFPQLRYYHPGVGTEGGRLERMMDGATGRGLDENVLSAYKWLVDNYQDEDRIFLIGFSRGAYTVRSLCGFITRVGLKGSHAWKDIRRLYKQYLRGKLQGSPSGQEIYFLGVWDTVGALGIPVKMTWLKNQTFLISPLVNFLRNRLRLKRRFHDVNLSPNVRHAFHAVALDERRSNFAPTLWHEPNHTNAARNVQQIWFAGVHADVGGGYKEHGLADIALEWMITNAQGCGATFDPGMVAQIRPDSRGVLHDSVHGVFELLNYQPRPVPEIAGGGGPPKLHSSVLMRTAGPPIEQAPYRPSKRLAIGQSWPVTVYAAEMWNATNIYCRQGDIYQFRSAPDDRWVHRAKAYDADGIKAFFRKPVLYFFKRDRHAPWFSLAGGIAKSGNPDPSGAPMPVTTFGIGMTRKDYRVEHDGYLFCFANDTKQLLGSSKGSIRVEITRTS